MSRSRKPFRNGKVHVLKAKCKTCIFRPGNLMHLNPGRVKQMVKEAVKAESCIVCHETYDGKHAVCAGFFEKYATAPLQIAERLGYIEWV